MLKHQGESEPPPIVLIHAGARPLHRSARVAEGRREAVQRAMLTVWPQVQEGQSALDAATAIVAILEDEPMCNAGRGAVLQRDGLVRLSASLMCGARQKFSGVMLASHIVHASALAYALQSRTESVLGPLGAQLLARELGIPPVNPALPEVAAQWVEYLRDANAEVDRSGTVGAVVLDLDGRLAAATSTGGSVVNAPERISDSATVAGNYATAYAAISCTGIGEQIVDDGVAVRLETRVRDGRDIVAASAVTLQEALARDRAYGWIALDKGGFWAMYSATEDMPCAMMSARRDAPLRC